MFQATAILGLLLLVTAGVIAVADIGNLSQRLPTQLPPRRLARYPFIAGVALLVTGLVGMLIP